MKLYRKLIEVPKRTLVSVLQLPVNTAYRMLGVVKDPTDPMQLVPYIEGHSQLILNERKICDFDLAPIYGVSTSVLNRAYKRNLDMFEDDWVTQLDGETWERLSQSVITLDEKQRFRPEPPFVYNAEGANSVAFQLKQSPIARKRAKTIIKVFSDLERMAHGEEPKQLGFDNTVVLLHSINELSTGDLIAELISRGVNMESALQQMKAERQPKSAKVIQYPMQPERLYGTG